MTIWMLVEQCARELTENGISPFTRSDIIKCVQRKNTAYGPNSINPIIQGLTDNLHGGAPGAVGKNILHSVGRGLFVLSGEKPEHMKQLVSDNPTQKLKIAVSRKSDSLMPENLTNQISNNSMRRIGGYDFRYRRMIENRNTLIDELKQIIVGEISRINQVYRRGPSLYFYHRTIELRRKHSTISEFLSLDYCIEIIYATLVSWDMNSRGAKMKDFEEFRDNLRANLTGFEKLESLSVNFSYDNARSVLECMSAIYDSLDLMQTGGRLVSNSKCLHFLFPKVCLPMDRKNTLTKIYGNTNESKNKFIEILELSYDILARIPDRSRYLDQGWNVFETKLVDNAILLKSTQPVVAPDGR